jgi:hypothetical protein
LGSHQLSQVRKRGALGLLVPALALFAAARAWLGDHVGAFADAGEAAELGEQLGYAADAAVAVEMVAWQSAARGLHDDAQKALELAKAPTDRAGTTGFAAHQALDSGNGQAAATAGAGRPRWSKESNRRLWNHLAFDIHFR